MNNILDTLDFHIDARWQDVNSYRIDKTRVMSKLSDDWSRMYFKQERYYRMIEFMINEMAELEFKMREIERQYLKCEIERGKT